MRGFLAEEVPGARVQVVVDAAAERARAVAEACGAADAGGDGVAAIGRGDVDAVLVAVPDGPHAELTLGRWRREAGAPRDASGAGGGGLPQGRRSRGGGAWADRGVGGR